MCNTHTRARGNVESLSVLHGKGMDKNVIDRGLTKRGEKICEKMASMGVTYVQYIYSWLSDAFHFYSCQWRNIQSIQSSEEDELVELKHRLGELRSSFFFLALFFSISDIISCFLALPTKSRPVRVRISSQLWYPPLHLPFRFHRRKRGYRRISTELFASHFLYFYPPDSLTSVSSSSGGTLTLR